MYRIHTHFDRSDEQAELVCANGFEWLTRPGFAFDKSKPKSVPNTMGQRSMQIKPFFDDVNTDQQATSSGKVFLMLFGPGSVNHSKSTGAGK